jgi:hypothetical protein
MSPDEAKAYIIKHVAVTRQMVTLAKTYVLQHFNRDAAAMLGDFQKSVSAEMPKRVNIHPSMDPTLTLEAAATSISWKLAGCEAIWNLISAGAIFPAETDLAGDIEGLGWTTVVQGSGQSSGFSLDELSVRVPRQLVRSRSATEGHQPLSDADLYLKEANLSDLHPEIEASLREAVKAFQHELYLACLAMLGKAMETAWVELGLGLAKVSAKTSWSGAEKLKQQMEDSFVGIAKKIQLVTHAYADKDIFGVVAKASGVTPQDLRNCVVWADCVRESRNSLHYGAEPSMPNSYEKVAALLIGAVPHIRVITKATEAAKK